MQIVVLHASALHLGFLGCYGNSWIGTPALDRFATEAVVFDQHYVNVLQVPHKRVGPTKDAAVVRVDASQAPKGIARAIGESAPEPCLCWVDLEDLCPPWQLPAELAGCYLDETDDATPLFDPALGTLDSHNLDSWHRLRSTYAAKVTQFDEQLEQLLGALRRQAWWDESAVLLTADCGLPLGEHGVVGHCRPWLHDEVVHVPLLIRLPGAAQAGRRVGALTQTLDVEATLAQWLQMPAPPFGQGLVPLLQCTVEVLHQAVLSCATCGSEAEWSLRTLDWAYLLPQSSVEPTNARGPQLYVKPDDRWEVNNVIQHHFEVAENMHAEIQRRIGTL